MSQGVPRVGPGDGGRACEPRRTLTIVALSAGGRGVARPEGERVWFVSGAVPGDRVEAEIEREHASWVAARAVRLVEPSPERRAAPCPLQASCGGCPWMVLPESVQRAWKVRVLGDALRRIGRLEDPPIEPLVAVPPDLGWRNRVEFSIGRDSADGFVVGLHRADGAGLLDVPRCLLQTELANRVLGSVRELLASGLPEETPRGRPARLVVRTSSRGESLVALREAGWRFPVAFAEGLMDRHPELVGVVRLRGREGRRGGTTSQALAGRDWIEEDLGGTTFRLPAATFVQVNAAAAAAMSARIVQMAGDVDGREVLDLYGGVGAYGLALAARGARVTVCDADREAIACGRQAASRSQRSGVAFVHADVARFIDRELQGGGPPPRLVIANPPRTGLGGRVSGALARLGPGRLVLVSCDPPTLARDLRALLAAGYRLCGVVPFDLFPQTAHVEAVVTLERQG